MIIFAAQLILIFLAAFWSFQVGTAVLDYLTTADSRIIQETVAGYISAASISDDGYFSLRIKGNGDTLHILNGPYVWIETSGTKVFRISGGEAEIELKPTEAVPAVSFDILTVNEGSYRLTDGTEVEIVVEKKGYNINTVVK